MEFYSRFSSGYLLLKKIKSMVKQSILLSKNFLVDDLEGVASGLGFRGGASPSAVGRRARTHGAPPEASETPPRGASRGRLLQRTRPQPAALAREWLVSRLFLVRYWLRDMCFEGQRPQGPRRCPQVFLASSPSCARGVHDVGGGGREVDDRHVHPRERRHALHNHQTQPATPRLLACLIIKPNKSMALEVCSWVGNFFCCYYFLRMESPYSFFFFVYKVLFISWRLMIEDRGQEKI